MGTPIGWIILLVIAEGALVVANRLFGIQMDTRAVVTVAVAASAFWLFLAVPQALSKH